MRMAFWIGAVVAALDCGAVDLAELARAEYSNPIRPGGIEGRPFWNQHARMFMYPPAFDFDDFGEEAVKYRFFVQDADHRWLTFDADSPKASLAPVWDRITPGFVWVWILAVHRNGRCFDVPLMPRERSSRLFWKSAPFKPGAYPAKPRSYAEAAAKCADQIFGRKVIRHFLRHGEPDPDYGFNSYPSKMNAALINMTLDYAKTCPSRAADALRFARLAADYLLRISHPAGSPCAFFPPTYKGTYQAAAIRGGNIMMMYPATVGMAYLNLHAETKEAKYLEGARRIGETYLTLQEADGTWSVLVSEKDGAVADAHRLQPMDVVEFLERLYGVGGDRRFRDAADRAFAWVEARPMKDWNWEGQFEDSPLADKYRNPSKDPALATMRYVLKRFPGDAKYLAFARDALRYAEDQFVCWERPCLPNGMGINVLMGRPSVGVNDYDTWFFPCALEQYAWYVPIDASVALMVRSYLAMYEATKNPLDLARARALGDALVRIQRPSGYIPTEIFQEPDVNKQDGGWINCTCSSVRALTALAAYEEN